MCVSPCKAEAHGCGSAAVRGADPRAQVVFFVPYLSLASNGPHGTDDLYSFGKVVFLGAIGAVSLEVG